MKQILIRSIFIVGLLLASLQTTFAKTDNPGQSKNTDAPGQEKKAETSQKQNQDNPGNSKKEQDSQLQTPASSSQGRGTTKKTEQDQDASLSKKNAKVGVGKLKDFLSQMSSESSVLTNKNFGKITKIKVTIASQAAQLKRHAVSGIITSLSDGSITLAHQIHRDRIYSITTDSQTIFTIKGITAGTFADLAIGQRIAAVGEPSGSSLLAKRIHVIPGQATGVFNKNPLASPSGSMTTTPSATQAASPSSTISASTTPSPTQEPSNTPTP